MCTDIHRERSKFLSLISIAKEKLQFIRSNPYPAPAIDSPARLAFDPHITRRLNSTAPLRVVDPPAIERTWDAVETLLDGLSELSVLSITTSLSTWEVIFSPIIIVRFCW
jgi:hypothetical protein